MRWNQNDGCDTASASRIIQKLSHLERGKLRIDAPNAHNILNTVHKLNLQLLFTKSHNLNTRGHSRKVVGNSIKQIKGSIVKQQVVTAATRVAEADGISKPRRGFDKIKDNNKSVRNRVEAPCRGVLAS